MYGSSLMDAVYYFVIDLFRLEGLVRLSYTDKECRSILFNALFTVTYKYFFHYKNLLQDRIHFQMHFGSFQQVKPIL